MSEAKILLQDSENYVDQRLPHLPTQALLPRTIKSDSQEILEQDAALMISQEIQKQDAALTNSQEIQEGEVDLARITTKSQEILEREMDFEESACEQKIRLVDAKGPETESEQAKTGGKEGSIKS